MVWIDSDTLSLVLIVPVHVSFAIGFPKPCWYGNKCVKCPHTMIYTWQGADGTARSSRVYGQSEVVCDFNLRIKWRVCECEYEYYECVMVVVMLGTYLSDTRVVRMM